MVKWPTLAAWHTATQRYSGPLLIMYWCRNQISNTRVAYTSVQMGCWLACPTTVLWGTLAHAYELQVAHRMALKQQGQWPRHACPEPNVETELAAKDEEIGSVSRNNTIPKGFNRLE